VIRRAIAALAKLDDDELIDVLRRKEGELMADNEFGYTAWGMDWVRLAEPLRQTRPDPLLPPRPQHRPQPRRTGHDRGS